MQSIKRYFAVVFIFILAAFCFIGTAAADETEQSLQSQPLQQESPAAEPVKQPAAANDGNIVFIIRPFYWANGFRGLNLSINDTGIGALPNASYTVISTRQKILKIAGEGGFLSWSRKEEEFELDPGKTYFLVWAAEESFGMQNFTDAKGLPVFGPKMDPNSIHWQSEELDEVQEILKKANYVPRDYQEK